MRILIVEDEKVLGDHIKISMADAGYSCTLVSNGNDALETIMVDEYDCIILDRMLPDIDGLEVCREIRKDNIKTPLIFLTALSEVDHRVEGLGTGADDYLSKPFSMDELLARVSALIRRGAYRQDQELKIRNIKLDFARRSVEIKDEIISLSNREFTLLEYIMRNAGKPLTRTQILEHVWDQNWGSDSNMVDVYINYLRNKIDLDASELSNIETVRGFGYRFRDET